MLDDYVRQSQEEREAMLREIDHLKELKVIKHTELRERSYNLKTEGEAIAEKKKYIHDAEMLKLKRE